MNRRLLAVVAALAAPAAASAATPTPDAAAPTNGGVIDGRVTQIDYAAGTMDVAAAHHSPVPIAVMPSTAVQAPAPGYHALTDVTRGAHVEVYTSRVGGRLVAQIIRLLRR